MCIFFVLNVENTRNVFYKTSVIRNTCSKGNIDRSKCALAATGKIYVYILRSKCGKHQKCFYRTSAFMLEREYLS